MERIVHDGHHRFAAEASKYNAAIALAVDRRGSGRRATRSSARRAATRAGRCAASPSRLRCRTAGPRGTRRRSRWDRRAPAPCTGGDRVACAPPAWMTEPSRAQRDDQRLDARRDRRRRDRPVRSVSRLRLVVVDRDVRSRRRSSRSSSSPSNSGIALARVEHERDAGGAKLRERARACPSRAVGRDDAEPDAVDVADAVVVRLASSRPGWNAVIWLSSRSVMMNACAVNVSSIVRTPSMPMPSPASRSRYGAAVVAERGHHHRLAADRPQVVRDVAGAAAPFAAHVADLERHRQHVRLRRAGCAARSGRGTP